MAGRLRAVISDAHCPIDLFQATAHYPAQLVPATEFLVLPDKGASRPALTVAYSASSGLVSDIRGYINGLMESAARGLPLAESRNGWIWTPECELGLGCVFAGTGPMPDGPHGPLLADTCISNQFVTVFSNMLVAQSLPRILHGLELNVSDEPSSSHWLLYLRSMMMFWIWRPDGHITDAVDAFLAESGVGDSFIGVHIRHGDACNDDDAASEVRFDSRVCLAVDMYLDRVHKLVGRYPSGTFSGIVIVSDTFELRKMPEAALEAHSLSRTGRLPVAQLPASFELYASATFIEERAKNNLDTATIRTIVHEAVMAVEVLSRASAFVGTLSSAISRSSFEMMVARRAGRVPPFISLDLPYCDFFVSPEDYDLDDRDPQLCW
ncbi:uncharacterized protein AMSG_08087 [Thecamonas trahens ATCC 50062]|uniref:Uncharacterized protein n=1 Tax=Thecamonas trahens ATCC 50062 TaxID=461836 RepID=A0A0L0DKE3_THETB|nr:hypothetical protein AMSG_08087 [Thecamonas trahens ATCC 50062]KNC52521.1 hypothetical protein AMSG_08087 [Thecamonas trahens ATCC 50062]|eukprot:XP_013755314.1 hypothetical protein AMSG_08087 [Thecamonas trahens ATCC 50062]